MIYKFKFLVLMLILAVGVCSAQDKVKVACIGNSITFGSGLKDRAVSAYPVILGQLLGDGYEVRNFGISGRTMLKNGNRPYWVEEQFLAAQAYAPDIVIIKLGTNDSKPVNWDAHSGEFEADLRAMVDVMLALPSRPKVYLCYPVWANCDGDAPNQIRGRVVAGEVIPVIERVAREEGVSTIDLQTTLYGLPQLLPDGVHPDELGHVLMARDIYHRIR